METIFIGGKPAGKGILDPYGYAEKEYLFLKKKYKLKNIYEPVHFLRMRPENFLASGYQLATLCSENTLPGCSLRVYFELRKKLMVKANDYWFNHYLFDRFSPHREKILGWHMANNIIINTFIPLLYTYGKMIPDPAILKKAVGWLNQMPAEHNRLIQGWRGTGISVNGASGSQALTELKKQFCDQRKCLECDIGKLLLKPPEIRAIV